MIPIKIIWIEPTDMDRHWLRRFTFSAVPCPAKQSWGHDCQTYLHDVPKDTFRIEPPKSDPKWPTTCEACGQFIGDVAEYQLLSRRLYRRLDTGETFALNEAPIGACWNASWFAERGLPPGIGSMTGDDGRCLVVRCPDGHDWMIDAQCSNCTRKDDPLHHCWVRHGKPEDGTLHVDKAGNTCSAGAGSIQTGKWHGWLEHGELHE